MTIEKKAKRYDEALEEAKKWHKLFVMGQNYPATDIKVSYELMFPELKDSEDERIRKELVEHIKGIYKGSCTEEMCKERDMFLAWLEKQGEQKFSDIDNKFLRMRETKPANIAEFLDRLTTVEQEFLWEHIAKIRELNKKEQNHTDKTEPKFHEGEWITNGDYTWKIVDVKSLDYILQSQDGNIVDDTIFHVDEQFHSFTIEDAKGGDVLAYNDSKNNVWICIFKEYANERVYDYCTLDKEVFWEYGNWNYLASFSYTPATKEQCDLLFQKMKEACYKWNAEKKELREIEENTAWSEDDERMYRGLHNLIYIVHDCDCDSKEKLKFSDWLKSIKERVKPQQEWNEEDEKYLKLAIDNFQTLGNSFLTAWLKSLKDKVLVQSKQEWSEEDKERIKNILSVLDVQVCLDGATGKKKNPYQKEIDWLNSLKLQLKQEWSEKDEKNINFLCELLTDLQVKSTENEIKHGTNSRSEYYYNIKKWLKSFRPQTTWKPSDEQMKVLKKACDEHWELDGLEPLYTLYQDLKKLKV